MKIKVTVDDVWRPKIGLFVESLGIERRSKNGTGVQVLNRPSTGIWCEKIGSVCSWYISGPLYTISFKFGIIKYVF